jgi:predicted HD phosphohydrolase
VTHSLPALASKAWRRALPTIGSLSPRSSGPSRKASRIEYWPIFGCSTATLAAFQWTDSPTRCKRRRAHRDGRDEEIVACALLHDIGDTLGCHNHPDIAAAILKPFVSEDNHWTVEKHGLFQGYYFFHHVGMDRNMREQFRGHPWFERTAEFCAKYDGPAFDPEYEALSIAFFEPIVRRVFLHPRQSIYQDMAP